MVDLGFDSVGQLSIIIADLFNGFVGQLCDIGAVGQGQSSKVEDHLANLQPVLTIIWLVLEVVISIKPKD